jgi:hypothetical protein
MAGKENAGLENSKIKSKQVWTKQSRTVSVMRQEGWLGTSKSKQQWLRGAFLIKSKKEGLGRRVNKCCGEMRKEEMKMGRGRRNS